MTPTGNLPRNAMEGERSGANHPFQYLAYFQFLAQEIVLDAATPGAVPKERLVRNAKLLKESVESLGHYWGVDMEQQLKELRKHEPQKYTGQAAGRSVSQGRRKGR